MRRGDPQGLSKVEGAAPEEDAAGQGRPRAKRCPETPSPSLSLGRGGGGLGRGELGVPTPLREGSPPKKGVEGASSSPGCLHPGARWHLQAPKAQDAVSLAPKTHACGSAGAETMEEAPPLWGRKLPSFGQQGRSPTRRAGTTPVRPRAGESVRVDPEEEVTRCAAGNGRAGSQAAHAPAPQRLQTLNRAHLLADQPAFLPISGRPDLPSCFLGVADDLMLTVKAWQVQRVAHM